MAKFSELQQASAYFTLISLIDPANWRRREHRCHKCKNYGSTVNCSYTGLGLGLRFRVRYIRITRLYKTYCELFLCGTEILGPLCANSGIVTESGIRLIDCRLPTINDTKISLKNGNCLNRIGLMKKSTPQKHVDGSKLGGPKQENIQRRSPRSQLETAGQLLYVAMKDWHCVPI